MKKSRTKRTLVLARETVRQLNTATLRRVAGGATQGCSAGCTDTCGSTEGWTHQSNC